MTKNKNLIILVSGRSGAGKTTLIKLAMLNNPTLIYLKTVTTRKPRSGDFGYEYISREEYLTNCISSENWDHSEIHGHFYGADKKLVLDSLASNKTVISTVFPSNQELYQFSQNYPFASIKKIFIDTHEDIVKKRVILERPQHEHNRIEKEEITADFLKQFDLIFKPFGEIKKDSERFNEIIKEIQHNNYA
jgi:guanylate kinase